MTTLLSVQIWMQAACCRWFLITIGIGTRQSCVDAVINNELEMLHLLVRLDIFVNWNDHLMTLDSY